MTGVQTCALPISALGLMLATAAVAVAQDAKSVPTATTATDTKLARDAKIAAAKLEAREKYAQAKAALAEKAKQASDTAKSTYEKAKSEYDKAQTPEAKANRSAKLKAAKLATMEKLAKAKVVIAEKAQKLAESARTEYDKLKASQPASANK